jgi:hypothetical protein
MECAIANQAELQTRQHININWRCTREAMKGKLLSNIHEPRFTLSQRGSAGREGFLFTTVSLQLWGAELCMTFGRRAGSILELTAVRQEDLN